jgi:hypothetical protein
MPTGKGLAKSEENAVALEQVATQGRGAPNGQRDKTLQIRRKAFCSRLCDGNRQMPR